MANRQIVHGGRKAQKEITAGTPLTGPGRDALALALERYDAVGRAGMIEGAALELEAASALYWQSIQDCLALGQHERFHSQIKTWAYLRVSAIRAWREVREEQKAAPDLAIDYEDAIRAAREAQGNSDDEGEH